MPLFGRFFTACTLQQLSGCLPSNTSAGDPGVLACGLDRRNSEEKITPAPAHTVNSIVLWYGVLDRLFFAYQMATADTQPSLGQQWFPVARTGHFTSSVYEALVLAGTGTHTLPDERTVGTAFPTTLPRKCPLPRCMAVEARGHIPKILVSSHGIVGADAVF